MKIALYIIDDKSIKLLHTYVSSERNDSQLTFVLPR